MTAAGELRAVAKALQTFGSEWCADAAKLVDRAITKQLNADTGGDGALSNARSQGSATTRVVAGDRQAKITNAGSKTIWAWLEEGTGTHSIRAKKRAMRTPYGPRRKVTVSGMGAKGTWTKGSEVGLDAAEKAAVVALDKAVS